MKTLIERICPKERFQLTGARAWHNKISTSVARNRKNQQTEITPRVSAESFNHPETQEELQRGTLREENDAFASAGKQLPARPARRYRTAPLPVLCILPLY